MPMDLLERIEHQPLPWVITHPDDIDKLRLLRAAGYVTAILPTLAGTGQWGQARVLAITTRGQAWLAQRRLGAAPPVPDPALP